MACKKYAALLLALLLTLLCASCGTKTRQEQLRPETVSEEEEKKTPVRITVVQGPDAVGIASLMQKAKLGRARGSYEFYLTGSAEEAGERMKKGQADLLLLPAVSAASLNQQTGDQLQLCAVTACSPIDMLAMDAKIDHLEDLSGKRILVLEKDHTARSLLAYLQQKAGLEEKSVTMETVSTPDEAAARLESGSCDAVVLPRVFADILRREHEAFHLVLECSEIWASGHKKEAPVTGCAAVTRSFAEAHAEELRLFLKEYASGAAFANSQREETLGLSVSFGILPGKTDAKSLSDSGITCVVGTAMKEMTGRYLAAVKKVDPAAVGGSLPKDSFYWTALS